MRNKKIYLKIFLLTILSLFIITTISFAASVDTTTDLTVDMQGEKAYLEWDKVSNATGYEVHVKIPGKGYVYAGDASKNRVTIIGLTEDEQYSAKVRGYIKENGKKTYGGYSNEVDFGFGNVDIDDDKDDELGKVRNLDASVNGTKVKLTWSNVTDAFGYEVHVKIPNRGYLHAGTVTNNYVTVVGFSNNEKYSIKVRAIDEEGNYGEYSDEVSFTIGEEDDNTSEEVTKPEKVTGLKGNVDGTAVKLTWNKVTGADGYEIRMTIPGYGSSVITSESTSKIITGLTNIGQNYATKVRAYKIVNGEKVYGDYSTTIDVYPEKEEIEEPNKVTGVNYSETGTGIKLTWNKVSNADGYEIAMKKPGSSTYETIQASGTSKIITGLNNNYGTYKFKVRAYINDGGSKVYGDYSSVLSVEVKEEIDEPSKVSGLNGELSGNAVYLTWNRVSNVDGYEVEIKQPNNSRYDTFITSGTSKTITGLNDEGTYKFKVRAYREDNNGNKIYGEYSSIVSIEYEEEAELDRVTGLKADVTGNTVKLTWNKVTGADGYEIKMTIPGYGNTVITTTETTRTVTGLTDTEYSYDTTVRAYKIKNGKKVYGEYSKTVEIYAEPDKTSKPSQVTGLSGKVTGTSVKLTWNKISNADGYEVSIKIPGYSGYETFDTESTSRIITGLTGDDAYKIKVRAYKKDSRGNKVYGEYSSTISVYAD